MRFQAFSLLFATALAERITIVLPHPEADGINKRAVSGNLLNNHNFADPSILQLNGESYAFATVDGYHIQMAQATDFGNPSTWKYINADAFPQLPPWVVDDEVWAPDIAHLTDFDDSFAMYYAGRTTVNGRDVHCLGLARNRDTVTGPYTDGSTEPWFINQGLGCQEEAGGQIDPAIFRDKDGSWYVVYKLDGPRSCNWKSSNCNKTPLYLAKFAEVNGKIDGYTLVKEPPTYLFDNRGSVDGYNIEAPSLVLSNDGKTYFMFYSRGHYYDGTYTVSYTYSTNGIKGPWKNARRDLLATGAVAADGSKLYAPGGADITLLDANMVFHADLTDNAATRVMHTGHLNWLPNYRVGIA